MHFSEVIKLQFGKKNDDDDDDDDAMQLFRL